MTTKALEVFCTLCLAEVGAECSTAAGDRCAPHLARFLLASAAGPCATCGAERGRPCYETSGATRMFPHDARMVTADDHD